MKVSWWVLALTASSTFAATEWTAASTDNFELITSGGARKARAGIQHFEEVRDFFVCSSKPSFIRR